jgi:hypothetical protein
VPKIYSFTGIVAGSGYTDTDDLATTVLPLGGTGLKVNQVLTGGAIQSLSVEEAGSGYSLNDIITVVEGANTTGGATINGIPFSASDPTVATNFFCTSPSNKYTQTGNIYVKNNLKVATVGSEAEKGIPFIVAPPVVFAPSTTVIMSFKE